MGLANVELTRGERLALAAFFDGQPFAEKMRKSVERKGGHRTVTVKVPKHHAMIMAELLLQFVERHPDAAAAYWTAEQLDRWLALCMKFKHAVVASRGRPRGTGIPAWRREQARATEEMIRSHGGFKDPQMVAAGILEIGDRQIRRLKAPRVKRP